MDQLDATVQPASTLSFSFGSASEAGNTNFGSAGKDVMPSFFGGPMGLLLDLLYSQPSRHPPLHFHLEVQVELALVPHSEQALVPHSEQQYSVR